MVLLIKFVCCLMMLCSKRCRVATSMVSCGSQGCVRADYGAVAVAKSVLPP